MSADLEAAYRGRRVCVTGGAGFIGSHLCDALRRLGAEVRALDDLSTGRRANLSAGVELVEGSILDEAALAAAAGGAAVIFHQAALASVPGSLEQPQRYVQVNVLGTGAVLDAARAVAGCRVVFASSSSVYGEAPELPKVETMPPAPASPYAATKSAAEQLVRAYAAAWGLPAVSLRYFNVFGPRQRPDSPYAAVIPRFAEALLRGRRPVVYGDGGQTRDFTHVADAVRANLLAGAADRLDGGAVNVASGRGLSVLELLRAMAASLGVEPAHETQPPRPGDVRHSRASLERARETLGYAPLTSFEEGLADTLRYYREVFG